MAGDGQQASYGCSPRRYTPRECDILRLAAKGLPNKRIAAQLGVSERTVATHLERLYARLGVHSRVEAVLAWIGDESHRA